MSDFSDLALSPNESRAARNYLGLSQAQAAEKSGLAGHKLKRFETGNYVPDGQFLESLRDFYKTQGYTFADDAPGARAKARGDVFPAGVVGETASAEGETDGSPLMEPGKPSRFKKAPTPLQYMRITPLLGGEQIDRVFDTIEENETLILNDAGKTITYGFLADAPSTEAQALAIALLRRLAENGLLYARLMGRDLLPPTAEGAAAPAKTTTRRGFFEMSSSTGGTAWKTIGDLLRAAMADVQLAAVDGDREAQARRKSHAEPTEVLQALVG